MRTDRTDYPVAAPYRPTPCATQPARPLRPFAKVITLVAICTASLLAGGFLVPGGGRSEAEPVAHSPAQGTVRSAPPDDQASRERERPADEQSPVAHAPSSPTAPRSPHPLDAAPKVEPKLPDGPAYTLAAAVDRAIDAGLATAKVPASPMADDAEFLRRVTLDLTGTIPTYDRTMRFLLDDDPHKRAKVIDELLESTAFGRHFAHIWTDLLIKRDFDSNKNLKTEPFINWIASEFNSGKGWDATVRAILTANGKEEEVPQALFYLANQEMFQPSPPKLVGATANLFMGVQLQCAECHVHPTVDKWSQKDFWGMAAFFGHLTAEREGIAQRGAPATFTEIERRADPKAKGKAKAVAKKNGEKAIAPGAVIAIPDPTDDKKTVGTAKAKFLEGSMPNLRSVPYRPALADWLTSAENRYFAPAAVNRLWAHLFARGIVHPVEDMHDSNAPSHPVVLKQLSAEFIQSGYDLKFVLRTLCNTRAYQRTSRPLPDNTEDEKLLSHTPVKVVGARELLDSLVVATGFREQDPGARRGPRGVAANNNVKGRAGPLPLARFFDTREYDDAVTDFAYGVPQVLKLMNTGLTNRAAEAAGRVVRAANGDASRIIEDLYLTALSRRPRPEEIDRMAAYVATKGDPRQGYGGVLWALLNSAEFVSNH